MQTNVQLLQAIVEISQKGVRAMFFYMCGFHNGYQLDDW